MPSFQLSPAAAFQLKARHPKLPSAPLEGGPPGVGSKWLPAEAEAASNQRLLATARPLPRKDAAEQQDQPACGAAPVPFGRHPAPSTTRRGKSGRGSIAPAMRCLPRRKTLTTCTLLLLLFQQDQGVYGRASVCIHVHAHALTVAGAGCCAAPTFFQAGCSQY